MACFSFVDQFFTTKCVCRSSQSSCKVNGFVLSLFSPVLHKMICGGFCETVARSIKVEDVDASTFFDVVSICCGKHPKSPLDFQQALLLCSIADRFQMAEASAALEDSIIRQLTVAASADMLARSDGPVIARIEAAARELALARFDDFARTDGFARLDARALAALD